FLSLAMWPSCFAASSYQLRYRVASTMINIRPHQPMDLAIEEAERAARRGEVPIGAVLLVDGNVLARAGNRTRELNDPTAHAEILVIREACRRLNIERLGDASLYVTLEPCTMCAAAISFARISRLYYGTA